MNQTNPIGLPARKMAVKLLAGTLRDKHPFDEAFRRQCDHGLLKSFAVRDRALVRTLVATALRRKGQLDAVLGQFLSKPLPAKSAPAYEILLIGAVQLLFLNTPPHAAIDLAVWTADLDRKARGYKGVINAVLRRVAEGGSRLLDGQDAARLNTPEWLWQRWVEAVGEHQARAIANAHMREPALDLTVKSDPATWCDRLGGQLMANGTVRVVNAGSVERLEGYDDGEWWVQDAAAALPVKLLGDIRGKRVLDLCAAPGGKTAQLAACGADVTALDMSAGRLKMLRDNLKRLQLTADIVEADLLAFFPDEPFDHVLLDAPCSATGTIRRHPDIAYLKSNQMIAELADLQQAMLSRAATFVKPGGKLVFCTCSLEPEEGMRHVEWVLAEDIGLEFSPIKSGEVDGLTEPMIEAGALRTLPCHFQNADPALSGIDGFFACRFARR